MKLSNFLRRLCLGAAPLLATALPAANFNANDAATLNAAVNSANGLAGSHVIFLASGTYSLNGELPTIAINRNITFQGLSGNPADVIINQTQPGIRILETALPGNNVNNIVLTFENLTFQNGQGGNYGGGALLVGGIGSATTVRNCVFNNNRTDAGVNVNAGGAIENSPNGDVTVIGCKFTGNSSAVYGGAIDFLNQAGGNGTLVVKDSVFKNNSSQSDGGAIKASTDAGTIQILNCDFDSNSALGTGALGARGGAIAHVQGALTANFNRFFNNQAGEPANGKTLWQSASGGACDATKNWWGANTGPAANEVLASGAVNASTWLNLRHLPFVTTLPPGGSSTLTADLFGLNVGGTLSSGLFSTMPTLPSTPVTIFHNATLGSLAAPSTQFANGLATAMFTAGFAKGFATIDATLDNQTVTVQIGLPTSVTSINRVNATPSNLASVQWTVTFADAISGLAAGNFTLFASGLSGIPGITTVTPVGGAPATQWTVTVGTGTGTGSLGLNLANATGLSAPLSTALPMAGQVYTIDLVAPTVSLNATPPANSSSASATFAFTGADVGTGIARFETSLDGGAFNPSPSPFVVASLADGAHTFAVRSVDNAGNVTPAPATYNWTVDTIAPTIAISAPSVTTTESGPVQYTVTYTDTHFAASTLAPANITLNTTETAAGTLTVSGSGNTRQVTISNLTGHGVMGISIAAGTASDLGGNLAPAAGPSATFIVNHSPVPGAATLQRYPTQPTKIKVTTLLASVSDADGDTLTLASVQSPTPGGATVTISGAWIIYTPPAGFTSADTFNYTVNDPRGGSATGIAHVNLITDDSQSGNLTGIQNLGGGAFRITFNGIPNRVYTVQYAPAINGPWSALGAATADVSGHGAIDDPAGSVLKFYRTVYP